MVSLLHDDEDSRGPVVNGFLWCNDVFLQLDVTKTKEICIDFGRTHPTAVNSDINGQKVEVEIIINNWLQKSIG